MAKAARAAVAAARAADSEVEVADVRRDSHADSDAGI